MFKRLLTILSIAALMATSFVVSPVAASPTTIDSFTIFDSDSDCEKTGMVWVDDIPTIVLDDYDGHGGQKIEKLSGEAPIILHGGSSTNVQAIVIIETTGIASGISYPGLTVDYYQGATYEKLGEGLYKLNVTGNSFYLGLKGDSIEVGYYLKITATLTTNATVLNGAISSISQNGVAFDGIIYVNSWAEIEIPLDMLYNFDMSLSPGYITSFNVGADGLWIKVQGLYQYSENYDFVTFYDWIGNSPIPRGEEEESYYWYITLSGPAGWYDLQIYVDFV